MKTGMIDVCSHHARGLRVAYYETDNSLEVQLSTKRARKSSFKAMRAPDYEIVAETLTMSLSGN